MIEMSEIKLLPCPFCGGEKLDQEYADQGEWTEYWIECPNCEVVISRDTKGKAITAWNTRVNPPSQQ